MAVRGLGWVTAAPSVLAVLLSPGLLLLWDYKSECRALWENEVG